MYSEQIIIANKGLFGVEGLAKFVVERAETELHAQTSPSKTADNVHSRLPRVKLVRYNPNNGPDYHEKLSYQSTINTVIRRLIL